jgi:hypothetical protein
MSHFTTIKTHFKSKECLIKALQELGFAEVEVYDRLENLYGYLGDLRPERAEIIVRSKSLSISSNDLGFRYNSSTQSWDAIISEYDQKSGSCAPGRGLGPTFLKLPSVSGQPYTGRLVDEYALQVALESARRNGASVAEVKRTADGEIKVVLRGTTGTRGQQQASTVRSRAR